MKDNSKAKTNIVQKIRNAPPEVFHDRFMLFFIILSVWLFCKLLEFIIPDKILGAFPFPVQLIVFFLLIFSFSIYSIIIYFAQKRLFLQRNEPATLSHSPFVDIFVPMHNEATVIKDTIENLLLIDYPNYKIWLLDDRSFDSTCDIVQEVIDSQDNISDKLELIRRNDPDRAGKAASLNEALKISSGEYILVCDADAKIEPDCLQKSIPYFLTNERVGGVQYQKKISNFDYNWLTRCQDLEMALDTYLQSGSDALNGFVELRGNGQIASRDCLESVGGWDERTLTDDLEISTRILLDNWRIRFAPEIVVQEEGIPTPIALIHQRKRWIEGSLRRLLAFLPHCISPNNNLSLKQKLDLLPFIIEFSIPTWVFLDCISQVINLLLGKGTYLPPLTVGTAALGFVIYAQAFAAVRYWRPNYNWSESIKYSVIAHIHGTFHWPSIVLWVMRKVLFGRRPTQWIKSPRMNSLPGKSN